MKQFNVVLTGSTLHGKPIPVVANSLSALINREVGFATALLQGDPTKIKSGIDAVTGGQYIGALARIGVDAYLEPETLEIDVGLAAPGQIHPSSSSPAESSNSNRGQAETEVSVQKASPSDLYRAAIGPRSQTFYLDKFRLADVAGKAVLSWNWPAFLFSGVWALYRKMYRWFFALWALAALSLLLDKGGAGWLTLIVDVLALVAFAIYANTLYHRQIQRRIAVARTANSDQSGLLDYLRARGGVLRWVPWLAGGLPVLGILAAIALPAYQNYTERADLAIVKQPDIIDPFDSAARTPSIFDGLPKQIPDNTNDSQRTVEPTEPRDQFNLGVEYEVGRGVAQDAAEAVKWYRRAADQGHRGAQNNLGRMYANGEGVPQNYSLAAAWFRKAADQGDAVAQFNLSGMYAEGQGVPKDRVQAYVYASLAASSSELTKVREDAVMLRDLLAGVLSSTQLAKAQSLVRELSRR